MRHSVNHLWLACRLRDTLGLAGVGALAATLAAFVAALAGVEAAAETFLGAAIWAVGLLAGVVVVTALCGCAEAGTRQPRTGFRPTWGATEGGCHD